MMQRGVDCIGIGTGAVIRKRDVFSDYYLLMQRGPACHYDAGLWEFPGGSVEVGETLEEAVIREVREETGLRVRVIRQLRLRELTSPGQHWLGFTFLCDIVSGEATIQEPAKCLEMRWCSADEIDALQPELNTWAKTDWAAIRRDL